MIVGELAVTDGTTYIDLKSGAFRLVDWTPVVAPEKGGGVWNDSMLVDNRRPVMFKRGNAVETFQLRVVTATQDDTIKEAQELRRLLEKAKDYWTNTWQNAPVWLVARGSCETNTRYAYIVNYDASRDDDPYQSPFYGGILATMDEFALMIERFDWMSHAPGQGACVAVASQQTYWAATGTDSSQPTQSEDDCQVNIKTGAIVLNGVSITLGPIYASGIRFRNVAIPAGATVTYARIDVVASNDDAGGLIQYCIYGEDNAAPAIFSTYANFMGRARTTASYQGNIWASWTAASTYTVMWNSPFSRAIIQEIVDLGGWAAGNNLAVLIFDTGTSTDERRYSTFDAGPGAPILYLEWELGSTTERGRAATCLDETYIANKHNVAQITDAYYYDAAPGVWSGNLIGAVPPFNLFPAVPAAGDILYIGIDTSLLDSGPFTSVIFDIGSGSGIIDVDYEYWNGAWTPLSVQYDSMYNPLTGYFYNPGVGSISFEQESDWTTNAAAPAVGVTGYWIRIEIIAVNAAPTAPTQNNRDIYTVVRPSVDIDELQVSGDVPALAQMLLEDWAGTYNSQSAILATRSQDRGANFRMYLNFSEDQNIAGVNVAAGTNTAFAAYLESPTGRAMLYNPGAGSVGDCSITLDTALINDYIGRYRVYLRVDRESAITDCTVQLKVGVQDITALYTSYYFESPVETVASSAEAYLIDFGVVDIPGLGIVKEGEDFMPVIFTLDLANTTATPNLYIYDLILIPIDEWAGEFVIRDPDTNTAETIGVTSAPEYNYLDVDSLNMKRRISSFIRYSDGDRVQYTWKDITSAACQLQANKDQQVFAIMRQWNSTDDIWTAPVKGLGRLRINAVARYLSMRGDR